MFLEANRHYSIADRIILHLDHALRTISGNSLTTDRINPAFNIPEPDLKVCEKQNTLGLMRVNHAGEIAAQGLYQGQSLTAHNYLIKQAMEQSAREENDHLCWCRTRLQELGGHPSYLTPVWYMGSLLLGMMAGAIGDKWSLSFLEETEKQVTEHLEGHQQRLSEKDLKTAKIIAQMRIDEANHADKAREAGAVPLPAFIKRGMQTFAKIMTISAYYI